MTALSEDKAITYKDGEEIPFEVAGSETIYGGSLVAVASDGYANAGADTSGYTFAGVAADRSDNSGGSDGDVSVVCKRRGTYLFDIGTSVTVADIGKRVYISDDQTVDLSTGVSENIYCGNIAGIYSTSQVWVDIEPAVRQADVATHTADAADAHDASAISVADSGGFTDETDVEAALQELYPGVPHVAIADPGDGGAIPVGRSGQCAITTTGVDDTRTLAIPTYVGQLLVISLDVDAGDAVITAAAAINQTGNTVITMADAGDTVVLVGVQVGGAKVWRVVSNDGATLSTP